MLTKHGYARCARAPSRTRTIRPGTVTNPLMSPNDGVPAPASIAGDRQLVEEFKLREAIAMLPPRATPR
jgi:hypothetical protein